MQENDFGNLIEVQLMTIAFFYYLAFIIFALFFTRGTSNVFSFDIVMENGFWLLVIADNRIVVP
jgi:hypothetical protein